MGATEPGVLEKSAENMIGMLKEDRVEVQISLVREHSEKINPPVLFGFRFRWEGQWWHRIHPTCSAVRLRLV